LQEGTIRSDTYQKATARTAAAETTAECHVSGECGRVYVAPVSHWRIYVRNEFNPE
jgi:hypothetical protein